MQTRMKEFLVEWILYLGTKPIYEKEIRQHAYDKSMAWTNTLELCIDSGYIENLSDPFSKKYEYSITKAGLEYVSS